MIDFIPVSYGMLNKNCDVVNMKPEVKNVFKESLSGPFQMAVLLHLAVW